jgi:hypothetical protein
MKNKDINNIVKGTVAHDEFIDKLYKLKHNARSAKELYVYHLEEQRKAKIRWTISRAEVIRCRENGYKNEVNNGN